MWYVKCGLCGEEQDHVLHSPSSACSDCLAPQDHHSYRADSTSLEAVANDLLSALKRIADAEVRPSSKHRGYVNVEDVKTMQRIARNAIANAESKG